MFTTPDYTPVPAADMPSALKGPPPYDERARQRDKAKIDALSDRQLLSLMVSHAYDAGMQHQIADAGYYAARAQFWFTALYRRAFGG